MIFRAYFVDMEETEDWSPSLPHFLEIHDKLLYEEVQVVAAQSITVVMNGSMLQGLQDDEMPTEEDEERVWWTEPKLPQFEWVLPHPISRWSPSCVSIASE